MPLSPSEETVELIRIVRGARGPRGDPHGAGPALRLRHDGALGAPARLRPARRVRARRRRPRHPRAAGRQGHEDLRPLRGRERPVRPLHPRLPPLPPRAALRRRSAGDPEAHRGLVAGVVGPLPPAALGAARMGRGRHSLSHHAQDDDLPADRRAGGGAHHLAAGAHRWLPQLGLPLLLDPRCHAHALCPRQCRLLRGGGCLPPVAAARRRGLSRADADHVRPGGRAPPDRDRTALAPGLRGQPPRAHRQRRPRPAAARCLWRADGFAAHGPALPRRPPARGMAAAGRAAEEPGADSGASPTKASGRCAARRATSPIRR